MSPHSSRDITILGEPAASGVTPPVGSRGKGVINLVHLYPREMSIYGDLGNTRCLAARIRRHGYVPVVHQHHPGDTIPGDTHLLVGGGGQDSGQVRVQDDLAANADTIKGLSADGVPMLMVCGTYQLWGNEFVTVDGRRIPGLGILDVTTRGNDTRMVGPVVVDTEYGDIVGYENHSGSTLVGSGSTPLGTVKAGYGNNAKDATEGAVVAHTIGTYLHGPILPANPKLADALIGWAAEHATGTPFDPEDLDDSLATGAHDKQVARLQR